MPPPSCGGRGLGVAGGVGYGAGSAALSAWLFLRYVLFVWLQWERPGFRRALFRLGSLF